MELSFEKLRAIHRLEKESKTLIHLEPDFYDQLREYLAKEKEKLKEAFENLDFTMLLRLKNLVQLVDEIVAMRMEKVVRLAMIHLQDNVEPENLVGWEKDLYNQLKELLLNYSKDVRASLSGVKEEVAEEKKEEETGVIVVRILQDIPAFVGTDFKEYGPYTRGEEVPLPRDIAEILILRGLAEVKG